MRFAFLGLSSNQSRLPSNEKATLLILAIELMSEFGLFTNGAVLID